MEEYDVVASVASVSESTVSVSVPTGDETLVGNLEGQIEASSVEGEGEGDGGEIMVEVVGSDVFVDGVGGHACGGDLNDQGGGDGSVKEGFRGGLESIDDVGDVVGGVESREEGYLGGQVCDARAETGSSHRAGALDDEARNSGTETAVGDSSVISGSANEQIQVVLAEKDVIGISEEGKEGELAEECVDRVKESVDRMDRVPGDLTTQRVGVLDDEVWNPGIETAVTCSSSVADSSSGETQVVAEEVDVMVIEGGFSCKDGASASEVVKVNLYSSGKHESSEVEMIYAGTDKDNAVHLTADFLDQRAEVATGKEVGVMNKEEILHSEVDAMGIVVSDKKICSSVEEQQMDVQTADEATVCHGNLGVDSVSSHEPTEATAGGKVTAVDDKDSLHSEAEVPKSSGLGGTGPDAVYIGNRSAGSGCCIEQTPSAADCSVVIDSDVSALAPGTQVSEGVEVSTIENGVVGALNENTDFVEHQELRVESCKTDIARCPEPESSNVQTQVVDDNEVTVRDCKVSSPKLEFRTADDGNGIPACSEDFQNAKCKTTCRNSGKDDVIRTDPKSSYQQASVAERGDVTGMDIEEVLDFKGEAPGIDGLGDNLSCLGKDRHLEVVKVHGDSENVVAHGHLGSSEQTQIADRLDNATMDKDKYPKVEGEPEMNNGLVVLELDSSNGSLHFPEVDENLKDATVLDCRVDEGVSPSDSGTPVKQILFSGGETAVMDEKKISNSNVEVSEGDTCSKKDEKLNTPMVDGSIRKKDVSQACVASSGEQPETEIQVEASVIEPQGNVEVQACDVLDENISISTKEDMKVETTGGSTVEDGGVRRNHSVATEVGEGGTTIPPTNSNSVEENMSIEEKQGEIAQLTATLSHEADQDQSTNRLIVDEIQDEEASVMALSGAVVEVTAGSQAAFGSADFDGEGDNVSTFVSNFFTPLPDGSQNSEFHVVSNGISLGGGERIVATYVSDVVTSNEILNQAIEAKHESCMMDDDHIMNSSFKCHPMQDVVQGMGGHLELQFSECFDGSADGDFTGVGSNVIPEVEADEQYPGGELVDFHREKEKETEEQLMEAGQLKVSKQTMNPEISARVHQTSYLQPPENDDFSVSDLVWGKVRSHPWWPGQISDPADASEKAVKYHKKDCFLVAYFGDRTFAWNDASLLKPFWSHFSQIEKQSNSETFHNAVSCALEEVSRRVELGLACSCIPKDAYDKIECQIVENTGIRQESSRRYGVDISTASSSFKPDQLVEYIKALAQSASVGGDRLELVIAKAQLLAFCRFKGFCQLPEFQFCGGLLENEVDTPQLSELNEHATSVSKDDEQIFSAKGELESERASSHKRKHNLRESVYPKKKERSLLELMGDVSYSTDGEDGLDVKVSTSVSSSSGKKRKAVDSIADGLDKRISIYSAKVSTTSSPSPKPSFKVGDCIRRVASQLTGSPSMMKSCSEKFLKVDGSSDQSVGFDVSVRTPESSRSQRGRMIVPTEYSSLDEMLSQLHLAARDPLKGYSFLNTIITFFSGFRSSVAMGQYSGRQNSSTGRPGGGRKKKVSHAIIGSPEEFEFDDVNDSYWTDRIIQNYSGEQLLQGSQNGEGEYQLMVLEPHKPIKSSRRSYSRKQFSSENHEMEAEEPEDYVDERRPEPTELILNFAEGDPVPSELSLNKMFRRFGPLKEAETEVDRETSRARVVFKKGSDAQVAFSSAGKFNIFGPKLVNYQLSYSSPITYKPLPLETVQGEEDTA